MKISIRAFTVIAVSVLISGTLLAQNPGGGGGRGIGQRGQGIGQRGFGGGGAMLLGLAEVKKELKLTADQDAKITRILEEAQAARGNRGNRGAGGGGGGNVQPGDQPGAGGPPQGVAARGAGFADVQKKIDEVLNADQQKRLRELTIQQAGAMMILNDEKLQKELGVTADQLDKMRGVMQDAMQDMQQARQDAQGDRTAMMQKMQEMRKAMAAKVEAELTSAQKTKFKELQGKAFKFPAPPARVGGGGAPGPGGGGR